MSEINCEQLAKEAETTTSHSLEIAAEIYKSSAKCFDSQGNRQKAGQYLTIAGDFYLELRKMDKAASCYGKAIVRHLMSEDIETAKILVEKGKEYGFTSATYQFKMALNALDRKISSKDDDVHEETLTPTQIGEELPDIMILPLEEEGDLLPINDSDFTNNADIDFNRQDFIIPQLKTEDPSKMDSFAVLAAVSKSARKKTEKKIRSDAVVKDQRGETKFLSPKSVIKSRRIPLGVSENNNAETSVTDSKSDSAKFQNEETLDIKEINSSDTLDLEYEAKTEIRNEYEEDLMDIEIVDRIPYRWEVVDFQTDFKLDERKRTKDGTVFTWKADKLVSGKKGVIEYILRKRVERSIILRKERQVVVLNLYHSLHQNLEANLIFVNTTGENIQEILIEDVIPPELVVNHAISPQKIRSVRIPTHDSTLYRWIFSNLPPGDTFSVDYVFKEKPLTRHYITEVQTDSGKLTCNKISQPLIDSFECEYIWMYTIENLSTNEIILIDRIPLDYNISLVDPIHLRPTVLREKSNLRLTWNLESEEKIFVVIRMTGKESFTPLAPTIEMTNFKDVQMLETSTESKKALIDIRHLKLKFLEVI
ncbi:MAG: hypothetical protein ACW98F_06450 [Candidatus Hodarchaeales archaeon]|jgi:hypothetical protein